MLSGCMLVVDTSPSSSGEAIRIIRDTDTQTVRPSSKSVQRPSNQLIRNVVSEYKRLERANRPSRIEVIGTLPSEATSSDRSVLFETMFEMGDALVADHGIDRKDIELSIKTDENAPKSGRVELASSSASTTETSSPPPSGKPIHKQQPVSDSQIRERKISPPKPKKKKIQSKSVRQRAPLPQPPKPTPAERKRRVPSPTSKSAGPGSGSPIKPQPEIAAPPPENPISQGRGIEKPFIPIREKPFTPIRKFDPPDVSGSTTLPSIDTPGIDPKNNIEAFPRLPETIYFGGYTIHEGPELAIPVLGSGSSIPDDTGIIKAAHARSISPPKRCIDGRLPTSPLVDKDRFRIGFDPGIYFFSGNHHRVYLSPIWLDNTELQLTEPIRISGYDIRDGKGAKPIFKFNTDTEIHPLDSHIVFRSYPVEPRSAPVLCIDARLSLENPGRIGKVVMYYRHNRTIYRYDALLRRLSFGLNARTMQ